ncbi:hypothetical protein MXB_5710 [Myxobolus squamalis]|nr:hypothetical protein MXB_5710 [Myxobolus squamalis]
MEKIHQSLQSTLNLITNKKYHTTLLTRRRVKIVISSNVTKVEKIYPDPKTRPTFSQLACCEDFCPETVAFIVSRLGTAKKNIKWPIKYF